MKKIHFRHIVIGLIAINIIVNFLNSVTISPFFHSGMYSESFSAPDSLKIFEITVNGKVLHGKDLGIYKWDMVHSPLTALDKQQATDDFDFDKTVAKSSLNKIGFNKLAHLISGNLDNDKDLINQFPLWYRNYLHKLLGYTVNSLKVNKNYFRYQNGKYILLKKEEWIIV